jgi:transposase
MQAITTLGLDIAKSVFQVHGVDAEGNVVFRRQLKRRYVLSFFLKLPPCLVGIEACATSHYWSRELQALGHKVRLMPPATTRPPWLDTHQAAAAGTGLRATPRAILAPLRRLGPVVPPFLIVPSHVYRSCKTP